MPQSITNTCIITAREHIEASSCTIEQQPIKGEDPSTICFQRIQQDREISIATVTKKEDVQDPNYLAKQTCKHMILVPGHKKILSLFVYNTFNSNGLPRFFRDSSLPCFVGNVVEAASEQYGYSKATSVMLGTAAAITTKAALVLSLPTIGVADLVVEAKQAVSEYFTYKAFKTSSWAVCNVTGSLLKGIANLLS